MSSITAVISELLNTQHTDAAAARTRATATPSPTHSYDGARRVSGGETMDSGNDDGSARGAPAKAGLGLRPANRSISTELAAASGGGGAQQGAARLPPRPGHRRGRSDGANLFSVSGAPPVLLSAITCPVPAPALRLS